MRINRSDDDLNESHLPASDFLDPSKPSIVLCHAGASDSARDFGGFLSDGRLLSAFNLIAFDLRFSGRTTETKRRTDLLLKDLGKDVVSAIKALRLSSYSLCGQGVVGCHAATWAAIDSPKKVQSLVLCSPCPLEHDKIKARSMVEEWYPAWVRADPSCAEFAENYYFSSLGARFPSQRDRFMAEFITRCRSFPLSNPPLHASDDPEL